MAIYSVFGEVVVDADPCYCTVADADNALTQFPAWRIKTTDAKEAEIKAATAVINDLDEYYGTKVDDAQPLEFPRNISADRLESFSVEAQRRRMLRAMTVLLSYRLAQVPLGIESASLGDESVSHRGATIPHEVRGHLWPFIRK